MEAIEKATGKAIIRIETTDLDVMEEVRPTLLTIYDYGAHMFMCVMLSK